MRRLLRTPMRPLERGPAAGLAVAAQPPVGTGPFAGTGQAEAGMGVSIKGRKRFYEHVTVDETTDLLGARAWQVKLDGRAVKTPRKLPLHLPTRSLALCVAAEWDAQGETLEPDLMPIMALSSIALQLTPETRLPIVENLVGYATTDTTMVRVPEATDADLHERQKRVWDPIIDWFGAEVAELEPFEGIMAPPSAMDPAKLARVETAIERLNDWELAALQAVTTTAKSIAVGFALVRGRLSPEDAVEAARVDEDYQTSLWGTVVNGHDFDVNYARLRMFSAASLLALLRCGPAEEIAQRHLKHSASTAAAADAAREEGTQSASRALDLDRKSDDLFL